jgi:hypothetical protein
LLLELAFLDLEFELVLCFLTILLILLLIGLEIVLIPLQELLRLLECLFPLICLILEILNFTFDDAMGHRDQEHLLLLLEYFADDLLLGA